MVTLSIVVGKPATEGVKKDQSGISFSGTFLLNNIRFLFGDQH
jgi:hypothetical protein